MHKRKLRSVKSTIREKYQTTPFGVNNFGYRNGKKEAMMECKFLILKLL
jgi:hypothetical protein